MFRSGFADAAIAPIDFPIAPTVAIPLALKHAGLTIENISLFEINEAFSVVIKAAEKVLGLDPAKVNVSSFPFLAFASLFEPRSIEKETRPNLSRSSSLLFSQINGGGVALGHVRLSLYLFAHSTSHQADLLSRLFVLYSPSDRPDAES